MKISIAVPSFNYGLFIDKCLNSIISQHYINFEVLIADGGSTDRSLEIINYYCNIDNRFRLVSNFDNGQADAINKTMQQRKSAASRERLKKADKVPTRVATGKKLFDEFMREAYEKTGKQRSAGNQEDLKQVYLAARALEFDKFLIFLTDVL